MINPFSNYSVNDTENFTSNGTAVVFESPFIDPGSIESTTPSSNNEFPANHTNPEMQELAASALKTALDLNRKYMIDYGWQKYARDILRVMGMHDDSWIKNSAEENLQFFTNYFANWQDKMGYQTTQKGVFELNNWTYFQKKLGLNSYSNTFSIDVNKAIRANKTYVANWVKSKSYILVYLNKGLPLNDESFAYMIAQFQNDVNPTFNNNLKVDGILGKITWDILRTFIEKANPGFDLKQHVKPGDSKTAAARYFEARLKYSHLMIIALEKIQSDVDAIIKNEPIEFNTTRATIYAIVNGIVGAVPIAGAAGNAMLAYNEEYWKNVKDNIDRQFEKNRNFKLNDIIYILKNHAIEESSVIIIQHSLDDKLQYSGNKPATIFSDFTTEIERLMRLNQSADEIMKIALSNLIGAFSPHTRIYIHCRNTTDFKDWDDKDISNLLNDSSRKRLNLRFTSVHPNVTIKENNLTPAALQNLKALWEVFKKYKYAFKDLKIKKDIFFSINFPLSLGNIVMSFKYKIEFSFFLKTLSPGEDWTNINTILNLPQNVYRLPNNQMLYKDDQNSVSWSLTGKNNNGIVYEHMIQEIANQVMQHEYNIPSAAKNINLISNETKLNINDSINDKEYTAYSNSEINIIGKEDFYPTVNAENIFTGEKIDELVSASVDNAIAREANVNQDINEHRFSDESAFNEAIVTEEREGFSEDETKRTYAQYNQYTSNIFLNITAEKQGVVKGSVTQKGKEGMIAAFAFHHEITLPRDVSSGMATGKRIHKPVTITKEVDLSSAKLLLALVTNERLKQVVINFWHPRKMGGAGGASYEVNYYRVTLTNAAISNISQDKPAGADMNASVIEKLELVYEKIEWQYLEGSNIIASDDRREMNEVIMRETDQLEW